MEFKGFFINLDSEKERRLSLEKHLEEVSLAKNFERFGAIKPKLNQDLRGLKSRGEYGLWLSYLRLFEKIVVDKNKMFLIIEDDFRFNKSAVSILKRIICTKEIKSQNILFLDYLINIRMVEELLAIENKKNKIQSKETKLSFCSAANWYTACTSCFLIDKLSAEYLLKLLQNLFRNLSSENQLIPVDMALKNMVVIRTFKGSMLIPPIGAPNWDLDRESSIQTNHKNDIKQTMRAYLLLRLAASGVESPSFCISQFFKLINEKISSKPNYELKDFYKFFLDNKNKLNHHW